MHLNILLFRQKLDDWYDPYGMENIKVLNLVIMSASTVATGVYIAQGVQQKDGIRQSMAPFR